MANKAEGPRTRVFLVDDHPIVRQGLSLLINQEADLVVCGEAENSADAMEAVTTLRPDLVLVDISLQGSSGLDFMKELRGQQPELPILVVSMHDEALYAERVLRIGARGYIMKQEAMDTILHAIRLVLQGEIYVSERMRSKIVRKFALGTTATEASPLARLSNRELEVFQLIGQGHSTRQIAHILNLSVKTVESHRAHVLEKLQLEGTPALVLHAMQWVHNNS